MRSYYEDYKDERIGGYLRFGRPIGEYTKGWLTYRYEQIKIFDVSSTASDTIKQAEGTDVTSSLTAEYIEDTRDSIFLIQQKDINIVCQHNMQVAYYRVITVLQNT